MFDIYCRDSAEHDELPGLDYDRDVECCPLTDEVARAVGASPDDAHAGRLTRDLTVTVANGTLRYPAGTLIVWDDYGLVHLAR